MLYNMGWARPNVTKVVLECYTIWVERDQTLLRLFWNVIKYGLSETKSTKAVLECYTIWIERDQTYKGRFGMLYNMD